MFVTSVYWFSAAHQILNHPLCKRLHGHNYRLVVTLNGKIDPRTGMIVDFDELKAVVESRVLSRLDHSYLNEILELPTAELVTLWIWDELIESLPQLFEIQVYEQAENYVSYRGEREPFLETRQP